MKKLNITLLLTGLSFALALPPGAHAGDKLFFPANKIETRQHIYQLDPKRHFNIDPAQLVDPEYMAASLLAVLQQPSRSCRETATTRKAQAILGKAGAPLGIQIHVDHLLNKLTGLSDRQKAGIYCNSGRTAPESGNLVAFVPGNIAAPSWNLSFHLDTNQLKFTGIQREGDRIRPAAGTPLGADDKAGIAIVAEILRIIAAHKLAHGDIHIVGLVAEEDSAAGAQLVDADAFRGDILVSIDGTDPDEIGRAAPSMYNGYITVATRTSHPAAVDNKKSVSACAVGAQILTATGFRPDAHPPGHPNVVLHSYFTSCGINKQALTAKGEPLASYQYNTISPFWSAAWQMRNLEGNAAAQQMVDKIAGKIKGICAAAGRGRSLVECRISGADAPALTGYVVAETAPSIQLLKQGFTATGKNPVKITAKQFGGFNGNLIKGRFGAEMVIVGTGADQIHTNEETISIKGMARVARGLLAAMLASYHYSLAE